MHISHITTMTRVGEIKFKKDKDGNVVLSKNNKEKLVLVPDPKMTKEQLKDSRGRVYSIVVDGIIHKIGGSQDKGGIQGTIGWYLNGHEKGNSERTYCTWNFITQNCKAGKKVEIWAVWAPMVLAEIPTMTGSEKKPMPVDYHTIELAFNDEYYKIMNQHPTLNMQESGKRWQDTGLLEGYINKDGTIYGANK